MGPGIYRGSPDKKRGRKHTYLSRNDAWKTQSKNKEIEALQKQLAQEKLHVKLLTAIIEIAETELKIPIRKKYGTKQSKK